MNLIERLDELRELWRDKSYQELNELISYEEAFAGIHPEICHYKVMAMSNIDEARLTEQFLELLNARSGHKAVADLYLQIRCDTLLDMERWEEAKPPLQSLINKQANNPYLYQRLGYIASKLGDQTLEHTALLQYHAAMGRSLLEDFNLKPAIEHLAHAQQSAPEDERIKWYLGSALAHAYRFEESDFYLSTFDSSSPLYTIIRETRLRAHLLQNKLDIAAQLIDDLLYDDENNIAALHGRAWLLTKQGEAFAAAEHNRQILTKYPFDVVANLRAVYLASSILNNIDHTYSILNDEQRFRLAQLFCDAGYSEGGLKLLEGLSPQSTLAERSLHIRANLLIDQKQYDESIELLNEALQSSIEDANLMTSLAKALCLTKDYSQAEVWAKRAIDLDWQQWESYYWLAESRLRQFESGNADYTASEMEDIQSDFQNYADKFPTKSIVYLRMAEIELYLDRQSSIDSYIDQARLNGHVSPRACYVMAQYHQHFQCWDEALKEYQEGIDLHNGQPYWEAYRERIILYAQLGRKKDAHRDLLVLNQHWPNAPGVQKLADELDIRL